MEEVFNNEPVVEPVPETEVTNTKAKPILEADEATVEADKTTAATVSGTEEQTPSKENIGNDATEESAGKPDETAAHDESVDESVSKADENEAPAESTEGMFVAETKEEIIERLKQISENVNDVSRQEIEALKSRFYRILKNENDAALKKYVEEGGKQEDYNPIADPDEQVFKDLMTSIREKRAALHEEQERQKEDNCLKKVQIIEKIKAILKNPDEVNKSYNEFRQLQNEWNSIKEIPAEKVTELWKTYQANVEKFYDTLKLNNEFRAYDFKKNLEMKTALCEAAEKLADEKDVISAFRQLQTLHQQFREIGPVSRELREEIWNRFKAASTIINKRHQEYFEKRKEEENNNLDQKTAICEIIESYDTDSLKTMADWTSTSDKIIALQAKWKTIGFAPQKMNQKIYDRFRAACDNFFSKKSAFFKSVRENMSENLKKKQALVEKAEALKDSQDWKDTADELIALQKEWTTIGAVPRKHSEALWKRFRAACDTFFDARKANSSSQYSEQADNLKKKRAIVARLEAIDPETTDDLRQILKDAQAEWNEIGHVPYKEKDKVFKALREQMDRLYDYLGESASKRRIANFKSALKDDGDDKVRDRLSRQAEILRQEIKTYENNLGFLNLSKSGKSNNLVDELNRKVDKLKADLKEIEDKIKVVDEK